jgi:uncharacterized repeat protein (TIGR01451 family)
MNMLYSRPFISTPNRLSSRFLAILLVLTALAAYLPSGSTPAGPTGTSIAPDLGRLPLSFVPNAGQTDRVVRFQAHSMGGTLFFTPNEVVLSLLTNDQRRRTNDQSPETLHLRPSFIVSRSSVVRLRFEGANPTPEVVGADRLPGTVNYFLGDDPNQWYTNLPTYGGIIYRDLYRGIDLHYAGAMGTAGHMSLLKGTYTVAPGADPTRIRWRYAGAASVRLDQVTGNLLIELPSSNIIPDSQSQLIERAPVAWQSINGRRVPVSARYALAADGSIGFVLGRYDPVYPLTLDPALTYSTYLGGSGYDYGYDIALDAHGNTYVVGYTNSVDFPTLNPAQPDFGGGLGAGDVFVVKLDPTGSNLVYATYLGGRGNDRGLGIALDADGNAYVTGDTTSIDFPTQNPIQPISGGGGPFEGDAFVAKLDATGSGLVYATYLGGIGDEIGYDIALDAGGKAYVAGYTSSTNFPIANAVQPDPAFPQGLNILGDAFVTTIISASGVYTWGYSTYLGGTDWDEAHGIAVDALGNAYVTGNTRSMDFPTMKPVQPVFGGGSFNRGDAFVTQIISASEVYTWGYSTYLGGTGSDTGYGIALDGSGNTYVIGETASTDFPTANPFQAANAGEQDVFVTKVISASGVYTWDYSTYLGGDGTDIGRDITVDADGNAYLTGYAFSANFPTTDDAYDATCGTDGLCNNTGGDAFFTKLNAPGDVLAYSTYLGGGSTDFGHGIALDDSGDAYLTGYTYSADFPVTTAAYDTDCGTDGQCNGFVTDAFVAKMTMAPELLVTKFADPPGGAPVTQGDIITYTLVATNSGAPVTNVVIADAIPPGTSYVLDSITTTLGITGFDGTQVMVSVPSFTAGNALAATFQVRVTTGFTTTVNNQATLSGDQAEPQNSNIVSHPVHGTGEVHTVYLPILFKDLSEPPPPPGCAPYLVDTINVGDTPRGIAIDTTRNRVYVANYGSSSLSVIDSSNGVIRTITGVTSANGLAYDPTHDLIWVTNYSSDQVTPVDAANFAVLPPITVGDGPWGVAYDPVHDTIYVANSLGDSVTVVDAQAQSVVTSLEGSFSQPFHVAANPDTGKVYVTNFGNHSVTVVNGTSISSMVELGADNPSTQPYGVAVDETRDVVYVATVDSHRVVVIGTDMEGTPDQLLGWAAFRRGFGDPTRPVPMRAIAINPDIGPTGDGGHLWTTTSSADGSEADQALLIPKGWDGRFSWPVSYDVGTNPGEGIAVDRGRDWVYVSSGTTPGTVTVLGDSPDTCMIPFSAGDGTGFEVFPVQR